MIYDMIFGAVVGGAFAALGTYVGWLVVRNLKIKNSQVANRICITISLLLALIVIRSGSGTTLKRFLFPPRLYFRVSEKLGVDELLSSQKAKLLFQKWGVTPKEGSQKLVSNGLKRLDYDQLMLWNRIRTDLARRDPQTCSAMWSGQGLDEELFITQLEMLGEEHVWQFLGIVKESTQRELNETQIRKGNDAATEKAFKKVSELHPDTYARFLKNLKAGTSIEASEGCWTFLEFSKYISELDPIDSESLLRLMVTD